MKYPLFALVCIIFVVAVFGCKTENVANDEQYLGAEQAVNTVRRQVDDFEVTLNLDKRVYAVNEPKTIWATIEYVGERDSIIIYHSDPFLTFTIEGECGYFAGGQTHHLLITTTV